MSRVKKHTGLSHWNVIARIGLIRSLSNPNQLTLSVIKDTAIEIDWKVFSGQLGAELSSLIRISAKKARIDCSDTEAISDFVRAHLERGINSLNSCKSINDLLRAN